MGSIWHAYTKRINEWNIQSHYYYNLFKKNNFAVGINEIHAVYKLAGYDNHD